MVPRFEVCGQIVASNLVLFTICGTSEPTPLDALAFAYLHTILKSNDQSFRIEVTRRVNLVAWEWRVRELVRAAFITPSKV